MDCRIGKYRTKIHGILSISRKRDLLILNPIGGAVADRFKRRQILLVTDLSVDSCVPYLRLSETTISCFMD